MKLLTIFLTFSIMMLSALYAETSSAQQSFTCKIAGSVTVDSIFRAIPPDKISMEPEGQKAKPAVLDRKNGYLSLSYKIQAQTIDYSAALYTSGNKNERIFLMVTRYVHYVARFPSTEGFWIFEYTPAKCIEQTDAILPSWHDWSIIKLPQKGTDLICCKMEGVKTDKGEDALGEVCATFSWDIRKGIFVKKK